MSVILDLCEHKGEGTGELASIKIKRDGTAEERFLADVDLVFSVETEEQAQVVERAIPGALSQWNRSNIAKEAAKGETAVGGAAAGAVAGSGVQRNTAKFDYPASRCTICPAEGGLVVLNEIASEVQTTKFAASAKNALFTIKLRLFGLTAEQITGLLGGLSKDVSISVEQNQQVLSFPRRSQGANIGDVVSGSTKDGLFCGVVVARGRGADEIAMIEVDDNGHSVNVPEASITSTIQVVPEDGKDLDGLLKRFGSKTKKRGVESTWPFLVAALGAAYASGASSVGDSWVLTTAIVDSAVSDALASVSGPKAVAK